MSSLLGIGGGGNVGAAGGFYSYSIDQSLRFNDNDSAKLYFDPTSDGNKQVWTFSSWVKRGNLGLNYATFFSGTNSSGHQTDIRFDSADQLRVVTAGASLTMDFKTNRVFRDVGSFYHILVAVDTTDATLLNRVKIYVNGVQETSLATTTCTQNSNCILNTASNQTTNVGALGYTTTVNKEFDGYMAEVHFVDGTQYAASDFGETINSIWVPKQVSGLTYGTNGFYLSFADSAAIGDDLSGNTNDFTVINSVASDVVLDSPTNNFATLNFLRRSGNPTFKEGNLEANDGSTAVADSTFRIPTTGKWYYESMTAVGGGVKQGVADQSVSLVYTAFLPTGGGVGNYQWQENTTGVSINNATGVATGGGTSAFTANPGVGTPVGVTVDVENLEIYFQADVGSGLEVLGPFSINSAHTDLSPGFNVNGDTVSFNFGADSSFAGRKTSGSAEAQDANGVGDFYYTPPTDALALCTANLDEPAIGPNSDTQSDDYFNTVLYTGDGSNGQAITGVGHQPDLLWIKSRSGTAYHELHDSVRGAGTRLFSNDTAGESTVGTVSSFDSDGFTVSRNSAYDGTNQSGVLFVGWNWKAGGSSNTFNIDGTGYATASDAGLSGGNIAADAASINTTSGISILKYTGDGSGSPYSTIKHGLDSPPEVYICKSLDSTNADNWVFFHTLVDGTHDFMYLNLTNDNSDSAINFPPTLTTVKVGGDATNELNKNFLMIAMHSVENFSKFGKYVGNGSADGTFAYTGFRPAWVMIKRSSSADGWSIYDSAREPINVMDTRLSANLDTDEVSGSNISLDFLSNGFKLRGTGSTINTSGQTYIYLAFAEAPFKYANAR